MKKQKNKMETKYFLAVFLAVAILAVSGCVEQKTPEGELKITADDLKTKVLESSKEVKSYAFDGLMSVESQGMKFDVPMSGKVDTQNKKSYISTKMMGIDMEVYVLGNTAYTKSMGAWMKVTEKSGTEGQWKQSNQYEGNLELFKDAKVEITGEEDVKGEKCYSLKITPDTKKAIERMMQQSGEVSEEQIKMFGESVKEMVVKFWVSKKTYYVMKSEITMKLSVESQGQKMDMNMSMIMNMYDYNKPVEIQIPEEALNAEEYNPKTPPGMPPSLPE